MDNTELINLYNKISFLEQENTKLKKLLSNVGIDYENYLKKNENEIVTNNRFDLNQGSRIKKFNISKEKHIRGLLSEKSTLFK